MGKLKRVCAWCGADMGEREGEGEEGSICPECEAKVRAGTWEAHTYVSKLARILREILAAGSARNWEKLIELAKELEELARAERDGRFFENKGQ